MSLPVVRWLDEISGQSVPETVSLIGILANASATLEWRQSYSADDFGPGFLAGYGWTELIGSTGIIPSNKIACGFLVLGPQLHYPAHAHEAEELYVPLAGTALWQRGDAAPCSMSPGTPIHHLAWMPHAMWTRAHPLVALYLWRGGPLGAKPTIAGRA